MADLLQEVEYMHIASAHRARELHEHLTGS